MTDYPNLIDCYELDNTIEDLSAVGGETAGTCLMCPRCLDHNSSFTLSMEVDYDWVCHSCGLVFSRELSLIMSDIIILDKEEQYV